MDVLLCDSHVCECWQGLGFDLDLGWIFCMNSLVEVALAIGHGLWLYCYLYSWPLVSYAFEVDCDSGAFCCEPRWCIFWSELLFL